MNSRQITKPSESQAKIIIIPASNIKIQKVSGIDWFLAQKLQLKNLRPAVLHKDNLYTTINGSSSDQIKSTFV